MDEASYVIGIEIHRYRSHRTLGLSQKAYIEKVLDRFRMSKCTPKDSPIVKGVKFNLNQCPKRDAELKEMKIILYVFAIGSHMYAVVCKWPDIAFVVRMLGRYQNTIGMSHWKIA